MVLLPAHHTSLLTYIFPLVHRPTLKTHRGQSSSNTLMHGTNFGMRLYLPIRANTNTSSTLFRTLDQDTSDIDNISEVSESQSIDINTININNNVSHDYDSSSNEIRNIPPMDITPDNHFSSSNIATRVKARNEKARRKIAHKQSQHFKTQNLGNTSSFESPSHEY